MDNSTELVPIPSVPGRLKRLRARLRPGAAGAFIWQLLVEAGGLRNLAQAMGCSAFAIRSLARKSGSVPLGGTIERMSRVSGRSVEDITTLFGTRAKVPSRGRHLRMTKLEQRHRALADSNAPRLSKWIRAAVETTYGGDHRKAAAACRGSLDDKPIHPNALWEYMRGWKYVYTKKNDATVRRRQQIRYPSSRTIDRLVAGLGGTADELRRLLPRTPDGQPITLLVRRGQIMRQHNVPLNVITDPRKRAVKKRQIANMAKGKHGQPNPKGRERAAAWWDAMTDKEKSEVRAWVQSDFARFQHPSPVDRMRRGWGIMVAKRKGICSPTDVDRFVKHWEGALGIAPNLVLRYVDEFRRTPHAGQHPNLDLYLFVRGLKSDSKLTWSTIARRTTTKFNVSKVRVSLHHDRPFRSIVITCFGRS